MWVLSLDCAEARRVLFCFKDTATTEIYTLSLHDALPIYENNEWGVYMSPSKEFSIDMVRSRSEEHTSELQSLRHLVCRLLLEKTDDPFSAGFGIGFGVLYSASPELRAFLWNNGRMRDLGIFFLRDRSPPEINPFPQTAALPY